MVERRHLHQSERRPVVQSPRKGQDEKINASPKKTADVAEPVAAAPTARPNVSGRVATRRQRKKQNRQRAALAKE